MGTAAFTNISRLGVGGDEIVVKADLTMSSSYATSGDTPDTSTLPLNTVNTMMIPGVVGSATTLQYLTGTGKIKAYAGSSEVSNATDLSGITARILIFGR